MLAFANVRPVRIMAAPGGWCPYHTTSRSVPPACCKRSDGAGGAGLIGTAWRQRCRGADAAVAGHCSGRTPFKPDSRVLPRSFLHTLDSLQTSRQVQRKNNVIAECQISRSMWRQSQQRPGHQRRVQDSSLKVRRAAMRVLSSAAVEAGSELEARVLHTVALKCRDRCCNCSVSHPSPWSCATGRCTHGHRQVAA
jgi:hypothetical protein